MADLIDRQAVLALPRNIERNMFGEVVEETIHVAHVKRIPSVDAVPVRYGKWDFLGDNQFRCTCCDAFYTSDQFEAIRLRKDDPYEPNFCPNCGADMRGEQS